MKTSFVFCVLVLGVCGCQVTGHAPTTPQKETTLTCDDTGCTGSYTGPEFMNGSDVAHQFSNTMCKKVGDQLKVLYSQGAYCQVNLDAIEMSTDGMGSGYVTYTLVIPFRRVKDKCEAYTSFDHVGGWNHKPALAARKAQLNSALMPGEKLVISALKTTPEGLQEYWIQWRNKITQADCN